MIRFVFWGVIFALAAGSLTSFDLEPKSIIGVVQGVALGASVMGIIHWLASLGRRSE